MADKRSPAIIYNELVGTSADDIVRERNFI